MSEEVVSVFDLVEKVVWKPPFKRVLPLDEWVKTLQDVGELLVPVIYKRDDLKKLKIKDSEYNKTIFLRTSVVSALGKIDEKFEIDLHYATGRHKKLGTNVIVISTKERIEKADFTAKRCTPTPEQLAEKKRKAELRKAKTITVEEEESPSNTMMKRIPPTEPEPEPSAEGLK